MSPPNPNPTDERDLAQAAPPTAFPPGQLPFSPRAGTPPQPLGTIRRARVDLFFAIRPPHDEIANIADVRAMVRDRHGLHGSRIRDDGLHLTLVPVGPYSEALAATAVRLADTVTVPEFEIGFDHVRSVPRRAAPSAPFVLGTDARSSSGAHRLHLALMAALAAGDIQPHCTFAPHVTLQHDEIVLPRTPVPRIAWVVREFVLIRSFTGLGRHQVLHSWPLH